MNQQIIITYKGEYVLVKSNGIKNIKHATELWTQIVETCKKHNCYNVLGIANTISPISTIESIEHIDLFEQLNINSKYRIAWIELNHQHESVIQLTEVLLSTRGIKCKILSNKQEAIKWLFYGEIPNTYDPLSDQ
jgi:hypothetical protein